MNEVKKYTAQIRDVQFGTNVTVVEPVNLYECELAAMCLWGRLLKSRKV